MIRKVSYLSTKLFVFLALNGPTQGENAGWETDFPPTNPVGAGSVRRSLKPCRSRPLGRRAERVADQGRSEPVGAAEKGGVEWAFLGLVVHSLPFSETNTACPS